MNGYWNRQYEHMQWEKAQKIYIQVEHSTNELQISLMYNTDILFTLYSIRTNNYSTWVPRISLNYHACIIVCFTVQTLHNIIKDLRLTAWRTLCCANVVKFFTHFFTGFFFQCHKKAKRRKAVAGASWRLENSEIAPFQIAVELSFLILKIHKNSRDGMNRRDYPSKTG